MKKSLLSSVLLPLSLVILVTSGFSPKAERRTLAEAEAITGGAAAPPAPARLQVYVLNVGRGQSVLVISPAGKAALVDAGPAESGSRVVDLLRRKGVRTLEVAVATQAGADYIGGMRRVAGSSDIVIKTLVESAQPWKNEAYQQMLAAAQSAGVSVVAARRGQFFDLGGGARLDILNPSGDGTWLEPPAGESRENANSVVVRLLYREFIMLIMGGAGSATAEQVVEGRQNIWAPFLVVGDGGSPGSVNEKMLSIVQPKFAIISTGKERPPARETLERLKTTGAEIYSTDTNGDITIISDGRKHEISKER